jgi:hypothetical protein
MAQSQTVRAPAFAVGDEWVFDRTNERGTTNFRQSRVDLRVNRVDDDAMLLGVKPDGAPTDYQDHRIALDWSQSRVIDGQLTVTGRPFRFPMAPGDSWTLEFRQAELHDGQTQTHWRETYTVVGWVDVTTPAGAFHTLEVKMTGSADAMIPVPQAAAAAAVATPQGAMTVGRTQRAGVRPIHMTVYGEFYYAPTVKYFVKSVQEQYNTENIRTQRDTDILASFKPAAGSSAQPAPLNR